MAEYIDRDAVFIAGDEAYLDYSIVQTARLNISAAVVIEGLPEYAKTAFVATENERRMNNGVCNTL